MQPLVLKPPPAKLPRRLAAALSRGPLLRNLAGALALQLALLISGPLSARILGPTNRGYLAVLTTCTSTIGQIGGVGITVAATYYLASNRLGGAEVIRLLRRPAAAQVVILTTTYAVVVFSYMLIKHAPILFPICVSLLMLPSLLILDYGIAFALGARRHGLANLVRAIGPLSGALCLIVLYATAKGSLDTITITTVAGGLVGGAIALYLGIRVVLPVRPASSLLQSVAPREVRREMLAFGRRGYVGLLSPTDTLRIDQLLIGFLLAPRVVGIYAVGAAFTNLTRTVGLYVGMSGTTEVARQSDAAAQRSVIRHTLKQAALVVSVLTVLVGLLLVVMIPLLFGRVYSAGIPIGECLLVSSGVLAMKRVCVDLVRGAGDTRLGTGAEIINVAVFLVLGVPAALAFGGVGVAACLAFATTIGSAYLLIQMRSRGFLTSGDE